MNDAQGLQWALEQARLAQEADEVPVGAVLVDAAGAVISHGRNRRESDQNPVGHAEIDAIVKGAQHLQSWRLENCTLYVTLEPCPMCLAACQQARVARVVYGAQDAKGGAVSLGYSLNADPRTHHRFPVEHLPNSECGQILSRYFLAKRRASE